MIYVRCKKLEKIPHMMKPKEKSVKFSMYRTINAIMQPYSYLE